jgi:hypothetical protein
LVIGIGERLSSPPQARHASSESGRTIDRPAFAGYAVGEIVPPESNSLPPAGKPAVAFEINAARALKK